MKYIFVAIVLLVALSSCDIQKRAIKSKSAKDLDENIVTKTTRIGDTVYYKVPAIRYKDTTITTINRVGSRIETVYGSNGQIDLVNCITSSINEFKEETRRLIESQKDKDKEKTESFNSEIVIYIMIGIVVIVMFGIFLMYKTINKNSQAITSVLDRL